MSPSSARTTAALRDSRRDPASQSVATDPRLRRGSGESHGSARTTAALRDSRRDPAPG